MQRAILRSWSYNKHPTSLRGCPLWQHFVYFFENVSLHVLSIHWATDNPTTEFMMCLRLRSLNQAWTLLGNPSPIPLPRRRLWLWTFCLALPVESCNSAAYGLGPESVPHSPSSPPVLPSAKFLPKFEVLGLYFSSPGFRCSVRVHRPTGKGLHLDSSLLGNRSLLCPFSKPTRRSVAQLAWCWVQANKSPWLAAFIRSDSAQLTWPQPCWQVYVASSCLRPWAEQSWICRVDPAGVNTQILQARAVVGFAQHLNHNRSLETNCFVSGETLLTDSCPLSPQAPFLSFPARGSLCCGGTSMPTPARWLFPGRLYTGCFACFPLRRQQFMGCFAVRLLVFIKLPVMELPFVTSLQLLRWLESGFKFAAAPALPVKV